MPSSTPLNPIAFKALAHPLRIAMLALLRAEGPATASQLAGALETTSGATSYHLRQLAKHGFIGDVTGVGRGRERYWAASQPATELSRESLAHDPESLLLYDQLMTATSLNRESEVRAFIAEQDSWGTEWDEAVALDDHFFRVTAAELADLHEEVSKLIFAYAGRPREEIPDGALPVRVHFLAFPTRAYREQIKRFATGWGDEE